MVQKPHFTTEKEMKTATYEDFQPLPYPQTPASASAWFKLHGICLSHWARHFDLHRFDVIDLLRTGKLKGNWGRAHRAAVLLGLKPTPTGTMRATVRPVSGTPLACPTYELGVVVDDDFVAEVAA